MPRNRMIKPEFWDDEKIGSEAESVQLTYIGLWTFSDDYGVVKGNPGWLKNKIYPYKQGLRIDAFSKWLEALEERDAIIPFTFRGEKYYCIRTFRQHQNVEKPSRTRNVEEIDLLPIMQNLGYQMNDKRSWVRVGEPSPNSSVVVGDEEKLSKEKLSKERAKALVIASDDRTRELKPMYEKLLEELQDQDKTVVWSAIKNFIRDHKPTFFDPYLDAWNVFAITINLIKEKQQATDKRRKKFAIRIQEPAFDFLKILEKIKNSPFYKGDNGRGWKVGIEYILDSEENYTKILESRF